MHYAAFQPCKKATGHFRSHVRRFKHHNTCLPIVNSRTFGPDEASGARITNLDEFNKCLDYFQKQGFNEVDAARIYVGGK
jgi:hypothetical protein